ncbi:MAG: DUF928 domain-containing protein [Cyanobacteria bacterium P01_F01_bin.53]
MSGFMRLMTDAFDLCRAGRMKGRMNMSFWTKALVHTNILSGLCLAFVLFPFLSPTFEPFPVLAQISRTVPEGRPGRRVSGMPRCIYKCWSGDQPIVALIPHFTHVPRTTSDRPSLHFVVPPVAEMRPIEFFLRDIEGTVVYDTTLETADDGGLMSIQLPAQTLQVDQDYYWAFSIVLDESNRSSDLVVEGALRYLVVDDSVMSDFDQLASDDGLDIQAGLELVDSYQALGLWNNAVTLAVQLRQFYPDNSAVSQYWTELLQTLELDPYVEVTASSSLFLTRHASVDQNRQRDLAAEETF